MPFYNWLAAPAAIPVQPVQSALRQPMQVARSHAFFSTLLEPCCPIRGWQTPKDRRTTSAPPQHQRTRRHNEAGNTVERPAILQEQDGYGDLDVSFGRWLLPCQPVNHLGCTLGVHPDHGSLAARAFHGRSLPRSASCCRCCGPSIVVQAPTTVCNARFLACLCMPSHTTWYFISNG